MTRHAAEWWAKRVAEFARTGDARTVAERHGVKAATLIWWRSELRKRARDGASQRMLPVVVSATPARALPSHVVDELEVFVEVGAARMTLRGAVSAEHLAAIVSASTRTC